MAKSNQRITKIKRDPIEELLKQAEGISVEDGTSVQPLGSDLTPYPDMDNLRIWLHKYLTTGITCLYPIEFDANTGETYYTTLIDGLPLYTRQSKVISQEPIGVTFEQPILTSMGTMGGSEFAMSALEPMGQDLYVITDPDNGYYYYSGFLPNQQFTYYNPDALKLTGVTFNNKSIPSDIEGDILKTFQLDASNDNSVWTTIGTYSRTNSTAGSTTLDTIDITTEYSYKYFRFTLKEAFNGNINKQAISYCRLDGIVETGLADLGTSKPGLWLSNLIRPYSNSNSGAFLRSNLQNSNQDELDTLNSDILGNYSFSFFQRGVIHRTAGSTHANNDSYCQHWSPSAMSCISHEAIIIIGNELQETYTSYQTLAVPVDATMQFYNETPCKDVVYNFVDNNNNSPVSITQFNGRLVGSGWVFEFDVTGNHEGSGTWPGDAGCDCNPETVNCELCPHCWSCVSEDVQNSGLCIEGTITYQNDDGTTCTQGVNKCFQTLQAYINQDNPNAFTGDTIDEKGVPSPYNFEYVMGCGRSETWAVPMTDGYSISYASGTISNCGSHSHIFIRLPSGAVGQSITIDGTDCTAGWAAGSSSVVNNQTEYRMTYVGMNNGSSCNLSGGNITVGFKPMDRESASPGAQENVDIYACVRDLRAEYAAQGIPWNYTCAQMERFIVEFSTEPCKSPGGRSYKLAEGVNIDSLGNITNLHL